MDSGSPHIVNNIVVSNSDGIWWPTGASPVISYNDVWENDGGNYPGEDPPGNISVDPQFLADGNHIPVHSPCTGVGDNSVVEQEEELNIEGGPRDIDGEPRIHGDVVDLGADETANCGWRLTLEASPVYVPVGESATITAKLTDNNDDPVGNRVVYFTVQGGPAPDPTWDTTDGGTGEAGTSVTWNALGGVTVTASVTDLCSGTLSEDARVYFYDPNLPVVDIVFCLDSTGSMRSGGDHSAIPSVIGFLDEMSSTYGIRFRAGCVRFNEGYPDSILESQKRSLSQFTTLTAFVNWLDTSYRPNGGDDAELQLDALHWAAQDMGANATSSLKYIVLITDDDYHNHEGGSTVWLDDVVQELTDSGCPVYISLWDWPQNNYQSLIVNGGAFDPVNGSGTDQPGNWKYPLANLRDGTRPDQ